MLVSLTGVESLLRFSLPLFSGLHVQLPACLLLAYSRCDSVTFVSFCTSLHRPASSPACQPTHGCTRQKIAQTRSCTQVSKQQQQHMARTHCQMPNLPPHPSAGSGYEVELFVVVVVVASALYSHGRLRDSKDVRREQSSTRRPNAA